MKALYFAIAATASVAGGVAYYQYANRDTAPSGLAAGIATVPEKSASGASQEAAALAPQFDTMRVEPDGTMVLAGRGLPHSTVEITMDNSPIATAETDSSGSFYVLTQLEPSETMREVGLQHEVAGQNVVATQSYFISPIAPIAANQAPQSPSALQKPEVLLSGPNGVELVHAVDPAANTDAVSVDLITYSEDGAVQFSGQAVGDDLVRLYVNDEPITDAEVAPNGTWKSDATTGIAPGVHTLRVDEVTEAGTVVSRVELPFKREDPEVFASGSDVGQVAPNLENESVVQPGSTLWAIARDRYGEGTLYVHVFEANRDKIVDPDLIYPGQVFSLPEGFGEKES